MAMLREGANLDFTRGVSIDSELLRRILEAAPREDGRPVLRNADFSDARLSGSVFHDATFSENQGFSGVTFSGEADFSGAYFLASIHRLISADLAAYPRMRPPEQGR